MGKHAVLVTVTIVIADDIVKSRNDRNEEIGGVNELESVCALHSCHNENSWVFFNEGATVNTITHEAFHAIYSLNIWISAEIEQEYFAFHIGYLTQEIFDFLNIKTTNMAKKKKKKGTY